MQKKITAISGEVLIEKPEDRSNASPALPEQEGATRIQDSVHSKVQATLKPEQPALNKAGAEQPLREEERLLLFPDSPEFPELLAALEHQFHNTPEHYNTPEFEKHREGISFEEVKACLEQDPVLAYQVSAMRKRGGEPDVWGRSGKSFLFFESVQETCSASRDSVYDNASAQWLRENRPHEQFNGSVEEQRRQMGGADVISEAQWKKMQELGIFTAVTAEWVDSEDIAGTGFARGAGRDGVYLDVFRDDAGYHRPDRGWRAVAKGSEV